MLRALGRSEPPAQVEVDGQTYQRVTVFKHDNWAATALYESGDARIVCKFNRAVSLLGLPLGWLGRWLAYREAWMLKHLADVPQVPDLCGPVLVDGRRARNAVAHPFVPGRPLCRYQTADAAFFQELTDVVQALHAKGVAYVDLHKRSNIIVDDEGRPHLIDFQISVARPRGWWGRVGPWAWTFNMLCASDRYHLAKHVAQAALADGDQVPQIPRPWWIRLHRSIAVPFRTLRRRLLVWLGVRRSKGHEHTEAEPEIAVRLDRSVRRATQDTPGNSALRMRPAVATAPVTVSRGG